jgi:hypothetical protein
MDLGVLLQGFFHRYGGLLRPRVEAISVAGGGIVPKQVGQQAREPRPLRTRRALLAGSPAVWALRTLAALTPPWLTPQRAHPCPLPTTATPNPTP